MYYTLNVCTCYVEHVHTLETSAGVRGIPVESDRMNKGPWVMILMSDMDVERFITVTEPRER